MASKPDRGALKGRGLIRVRVKMQEKCSYRMRECVVIRMSAHTLGALGAGVGQG